MRCLGQAGSHQSIAGLQALLKAKFAWGTPLCDITARVFQALT